MSISNQERILLEENTAWLGANLTEEETWLLREHTVRPKVWTENATAQWTLNALLLRVPPISTELTLWSGSEVPVDELRWGDNSLNLPYFTSSYDQEVAKRYAGMQDPAVASLLTLTLPPGTRILCLDGVSVHGSTEREVLLDGLGRLEVRRIENRRDTDGYLSIHALYRSKE
jgi:hypothetical protein